MRAAEACEAFGLNLGNVLIVTRYRLAIGAGAYAVHLRTASTDELDWTVSGG